MKYHDALDVINRTRKEPELLLSSEYEEAQLGGNWLFEIALQMGPNCNLNCSPCYGNYGPNRIGLPSRRMVGKLLEDSLGENIAAISLTDGEPIRDPNRAVLEMILRESDKISTKILTNGSFASTDDESLKWIKFLKDSGFNLGHKMNVIQVSCGPSYKVHWHNYARINLAINETYPGIEIGQHLSYSFLGIDGKSEEEIDLWNNVLRTIFGVFCYEGDEKGRIEGPHFNGGFHVTKLFPLKCKDPIEANYHLVEPDGRAWDLPLFDELAPVRVLNPDIETFSPMRNTNVCVDYKGNVGFGDSQACVRNGRIYGNIMNEPLGKLLGRIHYDEIYQAARLGGSNFLYAVAQELDPDYKVSGRTKCDFCHDFFSDEERVDAVRLHLRDRGVVRTFHRYVENQLASSS